MTTSSVKYSSQSNIEYEYFIGMNKALIYSLRCQANFLNTYASAAIIWRSFYYSNAVGDSNEGAVVVVVLG